MIPVRIISTGKALPSQLVTSEDLDLKLGHPDGYTFKKGGVRIRHFASATESQSQLGAAALADALKNASLRPSSIDLLISACAGQEQILPSTACFIAERAALDRGTPVFDVNTTCLSFLTAFHIAATLLSADGYRRVAVVSSDLASRNLNWDDPESSLIFGDGAAAAILEKGSVEKGIRAFRQETYYEGRNYCEVRGGGTQYNPRTGAEPHEYFFKMDGQAVFRLAAKIVPSFLSRLMDQAKDSAASIDIVVPHQASHLAMAHMTKRLGLPASKFMNIYETHGNQVAASIPTVLHEAIITGKAKQGSRILMLGTAAGLTVGGIVLDV